MKSSLILALASALTIAPTFASLILPAGITPEGEGKIFQRDHTMVVRKTFGPDKPMKKHNHAGDTIILTVIKGEGHFTLNDNEKHDVISGGVLIFDGDNFISGEFSEETLIVVTLVKNGEHEHNGDNMPKK